MDITSPIRTARDLGGAAWLGGALMGATGLNAAGDAAASISGGAADRDTVVSAGWARWTPIFRASALAHLLGSVGVLATERSRGAAVALALSGTAAGTVVCASVLGARKGADRTVHILEWVVPALLAATVLTNARR